MHEVHVVGFICVYDMQSKLVRCFGSCVNCDGQTEWTITEKQETTNQSPTNDKREKEKETSLGFKFKIKFTVKDALRKREFGKLDLKSLKTHKFRMVDVHVNCLKISKTCWTYAFNTERTVEHIQILWYLLSVLNATFSEKTSFYHLRISHKYNMRAIHHQVALSIYEYQSAAVRFCNIYTTI